MKNENIKSTSKYEVLAPAGSYECMVAAFNAGADAVYLAGNLFGARASANNFTKEELLDALEYAHIRNKKIFLTVNTLLKNEQIYNQLYNYIEPLYNAGLDAVIVQDFGVMEFIKEHFPKIDIHASTQMTVTGPEFAKKLKNIGISRIVPARELSLTEIKDIYEATKLEIECFVHGALCYCYSGMCLLSSIIGGRSGNRGRCAQPCRLPYEVIFQNKTIAGEYPLSPADLCTLNIIPDILDAGVYSLKIEGRMKKPEYVAIVTSMYRKYVDMYETKGRNGYKVDDKDINMLKDIYNRGEFTEGYYKKHNGPEIMSVKRPNHMGTKAAHILDYNKKKHEITAKAYEDLFENDVLEIFLTDGETISVKPLNAKKDKTFTTHILEKYSDKTAKKIEKYIHSTADKNNKQLKPFIMRTRNNMLISKIENEFILNDTIGKINIGGTVVVCKDMPVVLDVWHKETYVHMEGSVPQIASNRPVTEEDIVKQIKKTGATEFKFDSDDLTVTVEDGLFINIKELNQLRRDALIELKNQIKLNCNAVYKDRINIDSSDNINNSNESLNGILPSTQIKDHLNQHISTFSSCKTSVYVSTKEQFNVAVKSDHDIIAFEMDICPLNDKHDTISVWNYLADLAHEHKKEVFMCLPYIFRIQGKNYFTEYMDYFMENKLDGYVFRNMEEVSWFESKSIERKKMIVDNTIYGFNDKALRFIAKYDPYLITASFEMNMRELNSINCDRMEICVYGYIPVMISAGCIKKTYHNCDFKEDSTILKDRMGNNFISKNHCSFCYNIIYNSKPLKLTDICQQLNNNFVCKKYMFTTESGLETKRILDGQLDMDFTRGHFKRGVD